MCVFSDSGCVSLTVGVFFSLAVGVFSLAVGVFSLTVGVFSLTVCGFL